MIPCVLAFSGKIATGKTTLSREISKKLNWPRASFGDYVRLVARNAGLKESREVLQLIGEDLINKNLEFFCQEVLIRAGWRPEKPIILDGVRHVEVYKILQKMVYPMRFYLVMLVVDETTRIGRIERRGKLPKSKLCTLESHATECQTHGDLISFADLVLDTNNSLENLVAQLSNWIDKRY